MVDWQGSWIWSAVDAPKRNGFVRFRRRLSYRGGAAALHITADSRYYLYVNGERIGHGPVRAWPNHWRYDTYDLQPHLNNGENVIAVLVNHYGEGNFQYIAGPPGLLAQIELGDGIVVTDAGWKASPDPGFVSATPRISVQQAFEEQFDARKATDWTAVGYDDSGWPVASALRPAADGCHNNLKHRGIPFLTEESILPQRIVGKDEVRSIPYRFTIYPKPYLAPDDLSSNALCWNGYLATQVWAPGESEIAFLSPHKVPGPMKVNGEPVQDGRARLKKGWNNLAVSVRGLQHTTDFVLCLDGPAGLRFCADGSDSGSPWAVVGPFGLAEQDYNAAKNYPGGDCATILPSDSSSTVELADVFWDGGDVAGVVNEPYFQRMRPEHLPEPDVFVQAYTDRVVEAPVMVENEEGLLSGADWATVHPTGDGSDVRVLLDYGQEVVGFHRFDVDAPAGTILDFHNFEFIQPDGAYNFAEGMNNSFRYICREGRQDYQTIVRRGFRHTYLILRNMTGPVKLRRIEAVFSTYPQSRRGSFTCSDSKLDRIWRVGAHTLRCCAEDTYTDCPTYEQTNWVGDARNEALIDWAINGDPRLWYRCLEQTGDSLERSPITESHVPSAWQNILTAWSFLWMRSCREYLLFTGDIEKSRGLLQFLTRNIDGIEGSINNQGLVDIHAWNMFDWAEMDTPPWGVVTHQNCLAVLGLRDAADMADWLGEPAKAKAWRGMADSLVAAINKRLWSDEKRAYTDCLRNGEFSPVYSQQTQTVAYISGVAQGERAVRCREIISDPPEGFVKAGSPFFEFFLLEAYQQEGKEQEFLDTIRRDWGFMIDAGATTFWEFWSMWGGRLTRSHCHGWSAAPTFFLSAYVLGVHPGGLGFKPAIIEPHPCDLTWARGTMPTPAGDVEVQWENEPDQPFVMRVRAPEELKLDIRLPREGTVTVNGRPMG